MTKKTPTPQDLQIPVRNLHFHRDGEPPPRWWMGGDPVATAFFNALSCTFPAGEKFFIESVRNFRNDVSPALQEQIAAFIAQESVHSREHMAFNKRAIDAGYQIEAMENRTKRNLDFARTRSRHRQLAATCALEHFTAILAHQLLKGDSRDLEGAPEDSVRLWSWHAMEEIEHKAVAFDTFVAVTRQMTGLRRYLMRTMVMVLSTSMLTTTMFLNMRSFYRQDGLKGWRLWWRTFRYLFGKPGILRRILPDYLRYFKPGFHPWQHDDRELLEKTVTRYNLSVPV
ncbi:metal-dependent hydrolase [Exilibacterium tricleocarpae]|uniref:Metal-dependent hydrolase n=1 Tax=Exilibacterium tricleocarpae TaxID=2591008 RepID=A0A545TNU8_9GAMM|nr:metal-dependent hydrolase [Exilibacterium tricleocarpae]TQV78886.1 metal-dependent hydrolase [Exilibacterium tricleocarpae]